MNLLVFLVAFVSLRNLPSDYPSYTSFFLLHPHFRGSFPNLPSSFAVFSLFFLSCSFVATRTPLSVAQRKKLVQNGRTELILRARKAKGGPPSLELHGALAITPAKRESPRQSFCERLLNIRTRVVGIPLRDGAAVSAYRRGNVRAYQLNLSQF